MNNAIQKLLKDRYYLSTETTWEELAERVTATYLPISEYIKNKEFIPSSPTLMNANTKGERIGTLSSCFPMGLKDSIEGIYDSLKEAAIVTKYGGGVGYDFSILRGSSENITTLKRNSSGPVPFMKNFDVMLDGIQQGGVRRGAGMGLCDIEHPNILDVIRCKDDLSQMNRLNISIKIGNEFYKKLKETPNDIHQVRTKDGQYFDLIDGDKKVTIEVIWKEICHYAWKRAEPGIFNKDIAYKQCTVTNIDNTVICNPCSEFVNIPYSSCNLGSINLSNLVEDGCFNKQKFEDIIKKATRFLNNVIDINTYPIEKIKQTTLNVRPIGLGVMGFAHALYKMEIPYNSIEADQFALDLFENLTIISMKESIEIAKETGKSYPAFDYDTFIEANKRFFKNQYSYVGIKSDLKKYGVRNSCFTSIAPTGSIGFIANTSGGIEPVFALSYARKIEKLNREYEIAYITDTVFGEYLSNNFDEKTRLKILKEVADNKGSCQSVLEIPNNYKKIFVVAGDLTPMEHLKMLGIIARNTSLSVSKTINMSSTATEEDIAEVYLQAYKENVIGVTVYRDGCRDGILIHKTEDKKQYIVRNDAPKRPKTLPCHVYKMNILNRITSESEKWIVFVGLLEDDPYEIIAGKIETFNIPSNITEGEMVKIKKDGKNVYQFRYGGEIIVADVCKAFVNDIREYATRLMSLALRHGAGIEYLKGVLQKTNGTIVDFDKAIIRAINKYTKNIASKEKCPTCNSDLIYVEGCVKCSDGECSFSKCG